jgi:Amt family ammonium transporter
MNTNLSASAGAMVWVILSYNEDKKWHLGEIINGAFAGLAAITPGSGFVAPYAAVIIGTASGIFSFIWAHFVKPKMGLDDALDVFAL